MSRCLNLWRGLHRPRVYFTVEPILLVFMFAQFLSYSAFQVFLHRRLCEENPNCTHHLHNASSSINASKSQCDSVSDPIEQQVQEATSHWILYINIATGIPAILLSMIYGSTSDVIGRKLFIVLPAIGALLNTVVILVAVYIPRVPVYILLVGAFCNGVYGNYSVMNFAVYSYVSDVSAVSGRTRQIGVLESMTYLGAMLSQIVGGVWVEKTDSFAGPFWCILVCHLLVLIYTAVALPESLKLNTRKKRPGGGQVQYHHSNSKIHTCGRHSKKVVVNIVRFIKLLLTNWKLALLILTFFIVEINFMGITDIVILYSLGRPLCWEFDMIGYFLAAKVFLNGIASLLFLPILVYMKVHDGIIVLVGLLSGAGALVTMGVATHTWIMFLGECIVCTLNGLMQVCHGIVCVDNGRVSLQTVL